MYHVSAQGIDERMINVHYYYCVKNVNAHGLCRLGNNNKYPLLLLTATNVPMRSVPKLLWPKCS